MMLHSTNHVIIRSLDLVDEMRLLVKAYVTGTNF